ncbi:MAG: acetyl-CoA C-acyltransferase, partial [Ornithinibacter sp.]
ALLAGLPDSVPGTTVTRFCASSLQAIRMAFHAIKAGEGDTFVAGGTESVSTTASKLTTPEDKNPRFVDTSRSDYINDAYIAMGLTAENVARQFSISRQRQDEYAVVSQNRAEKAIANGFFEREITPVTMPDGRVVTTDDGPRPGVTIEGVSGLNPVFRPDGTVTAGNCCPLNDGAAAVMVMSDTKAAELGLSPLARVVATGVSALSPEIMGLGPIDASKQALARAGMTIGDMDLYEINEAFAAQVLPSADDLGMDLDKLNVHGGAIALGHPFGSTGTRIMTTLINGLESRDAQFGLETMCVGGGQGMAIIVERLS